MTKENKRACSECGRPVEVARLFEVDGAAVCATCLYGEVEPFEIYPIGTVRNDLHRSDAGFGTRGSRGRSRIVLFSAQKRFMYRLEEERQNQVTLSVTRPRPLKGPGSKAGSKAGSKE